MHLHVLRGFTEFLSTLRGASPNAHAGDPDVVNVTPEVISKTRTFRLPLGYVQTFDSGSAIPSTNVGTRTSRCEAAGVVFCAPF